MTTHCNAEALEFQALGRRRVVAKFDAGTLSADGGLPLLREVEKRRDILKHFAACFVDHRDPDFTEHSIAELTAQRILAIVLGYEDLNDHDELCKDSLLAAMVGKKDFLGKKRRMARDQGKPLASSSTLNRFEWGACEGGPEDRYRKISLDTEAMDHLWVDLFVRSRAEPPERLVLDLDATDNPLHGRQEGRFFHGYYDCFCYLPLYIFCGTDLLCARLRRSNVDASTGSVDELKRIVGQLREAWPEVEILVRGDSGFARDSIMQWCEKNRVDYVFGLARNPRLERELERQLDRVRRRHERTGEPEREFKDFWYRTKDSWSRNRRVIGKAEHLAKGSNPRFVVTSLKRTAIGKQKLYEEIYCARGEMENRIKEQQLYLFATRTSARKMKVNQLRLWFSSAAYALLDSLRRLGLQGTELARARCDTLRLKLLRIPARVQVTARRIFLSLPTNYSYKMLYVRAYRQLVRAGPAL